MLTCQEVIEFLADYLDDALPWRQQLAFRLHLALCRPCRRYLASYRATLGAARALGHEIEPTQPPPDELVQAILAARQTEI